MISGKFILIVCVLACLAACAAVAPTVTRVPGSPNYPPSINVEMLDAPPSRPYQEIAVIETPGEPGALRTQVLAQIRQQAQQLGADAVILQDKSRTAPVAPRLDPTSGTYTNTGGQVIPAYKGIAIKYR